MLEWSTSWCPPVASKDYAVLKILDKRSSLLLKNSKVKFYRNCPTSALQVDWKDDRQPALNFTKLFVVSDVVDL